jgi:hypothetical protein
MTTSNSRRVTLNATTSQRFKMLMVTGVYRSIKHILYKGTLIIMKLLLVYTVIVIMYFIIHFV